MDQRAIDPLVSVVTPVYNGADYLRECIDSLLNQTYQNWEYTIVDNCSTDATHDIATEYAVRDPRIRVHRNPSFVGVCVNHNNAMRRVSPQSKYTKILAADDWLFPECLEKMVALAEQHPSVGLVGAYTLCDRDVMPVGLPHPSTVVPGRELCRKWILKSIGQPFGLPTSSNMFRSDVVRARQPFYSEAEESSMAFDQEACIDVLAEHDFGFVHQVLTFVRVHDETLSSTHANRVNTYLYANLFEAQKYGPLYLSPEELAGRIKECLHDYYTYLGKQVYNRRDKAFWTYHREKLAGLGHPLNRARLLAHALLEGVSFATDFERIRRRLSKGSPFVDQGRRAISQI